MTILSAFLALPILVIVGSVVYSLPATLSLKRGLREGIEDLSIDKALENLTQSKRKGWELIEETRKLVDNRMQYCRRNSFDSYKTAFKRGYGYCQQRAFALSYLLNHLGFASQVVYALRNRFPDGRIESHAWIKLMNRDIPKYLDPTYMQSSADEIIFLPLTKVKEYTAFSRLFAGWGSIVINAYRYYKRERIINAILIRFINGIKHASYDKIKNYVWCKYYR